MTGSHFKMMLDWAGRGVIVPRGQNNILHRRQTWSSTSVSLVNFEQVTSLSFSGTFRRRPTFFHIRWCRWNILVIFSKNWMYSASNTLILGLKIVKRSKIQVQCESKNIFHFFIFKNIFLTFFIFFTNGWEFVVDFWHTYYTFLSSPDYKCLFNYRRFWRS